MLPADEIGAMPALVMQVRPTTSCYSAYLQEFMGGLLLFFLQLGNQAAELRDAAGELGDGTIDAIIDGQVQLLQVGQQAILLLLQGVIQLLKLANDLLPLHLGQAMRTQRGVARWEGSFSQPPPSYPLSPAYLP